LVYNSSEPNKVYKSDTTSPFNVIQINPYTGMGEINPLWVPVINRSVNPLGDFTFTYYDKEHTQASGELT
jgi:hypothetical protein